MQRVLHDRPSTESRGSNPRRGVVMVLTTLFLVTLVGFIAFSLDTGLIAITQTTLQSGVDAAALAASQEITVAIDQMGESGESGSVSATVIAAATTMAVDVAAANGIFVDPGMDVAFGNRTYDEPTDTWDIDWGVEPFNVIKVTARRDQANSNAPDGKLSLAFGWAIGRASVGLQASATSFVEARDIVLVLDYSGSMNDDSSFSAMSSSKLGQTAVEQNLDDIWQALVDSAVTFSDDSGTLKFPSGGFGGINSAIGTYLSDSDDDDVIEALGLDEVDSNGKPIHPFPQERKTSANGSLYGKPSASTSYSRWDGYVNWVRNDGTVNSYGYRKKYGYRTLVAYLSQKKPRCKDSEDLWRTPNYPFHAMKNGTTLFCEFLDGLDFGDHLGLVTYDSASRVETGLSGEGYDGETVDLGETLITSNHMSIDTIQRHRQAGHYDVWTGMGYGIEDARGLLQNYGRVGARPTMLVMTDGQTNRSPSDWSLPSGWNWSDWTDYDGDGTADYSTSDEDKQYAFYQATLAIEEGTTIHTLTVGQGADHNLMEAIAFAGSGLWIDAPGGATIEDMEDQLLQAFAEIAAAVPPPKLIYSEE